MLEVIKDYKKLLLCLAISFSIFADTNLDNINTGVKNLEVSQQEQDKNLNSSSNNKADIDTNKESNNSNTEISNANNVTSSNSSNTKSNITHDFSNLEFVILIPSYNNRSFCRANLKSAVNQTDKVKFRILYVNDCSTDGTGEIVEDYIKENKLENLITLVNNKKRLGATENIYNAVHSCKDNEIIALLDGDDFLMPKAIERLAYEYENPEVWLTYGQFKFYPAGHPGFCAKFPDQIIENNLFRNYSWLSSHLKTFKASLFKKIKKEDLFDTDGKFYEMASDLAFMYPMLEMASKNHIRFIPDVLYLYNLSNPINDHRVNRSYQLKLSIEICGKPKYAPLDNL